MRRLRPWPAISFSASLRGPSSVAVSKPRSAGVLSSTAIEMTSQRVSVSTSFPRNAGDAAVSASMIGPRTSSWSCRKRDSSRLVHWNVTCKHVQPIPNAIASMCTSALAGSDLPAARPLRPELSKVPSGVFSSMKRGRRMSTFSPRRARMFCVSAAKRGCGLMMLSATYRLLATGPPWPSIGTAPMVGRFVMVGATSPLARAASNLRLRRLMLLSTWRRSEA
mmetsp:Transcript_17050/g.65008  ORF Transcript_17050/g.65008 Transcript_17050/m.65008 type:complete len:222 (+) Transcript_17050:685-1350(+)